MHALVQETIDMHQRVETMHAFVFELVHRIRESGAKLSQDERVDLAFLCRAIAELLKDLEKESRLTKDVLDKVVCLAWSKDPNAEASVRGTLATGTPNVKMAASLPSARKDPEGYTRLMESLGVPRELFEFDIVRPHWPGLMEHISSRLEEGKPVPAGVDPSATYPVYSVTTRKKPKVELSELATPKEKVQ